MLKNQDALKYYCAWTILDAITWSQAHIKSSHFNWVDKKLSDLDVCSYMKVFNTSTIGVGLVNVFIKVIIGDQWGSCPLNATE